MNTPVLIVACITLLALLAHLVGGTKETASLKPIDEALTNYWRQAMCAFQMLAVDLLFVCTLLFTIALTDVITVEREILLVLSLLFLSWGVAWLLQHFWLRSKPTTYVHLLQWAAWFLCAGLLYSAT